MWANYNHSPYAFVELVHAWRTVQDLDLHVAIEYMEKQIDHWEDAHADSPHYLVHKPTCTEDVIAIWDEGWYSGKCPESVIVYGM